MMSQNGLRVNITGIPAQGAKSRVETQIKLGIQLLNQHNERIGAWTHIKLPEYMVAKEKNKRINAKNVGQDVHQALNNGTCLSLEASVVCQSDKSKVIQTCTGCVLRERKRAQRKKSLGKKKNGQPATTPTPQLEDDDPEQMALEQRKILLFNCTEIAEFNTGELILPTRITCYCRHHGEKQGFCIQFTLCDYAHNIIAIGISPPIMITDDHKASKVKKPEDGAPQKNQVRKSNDASKVMTLTPPSSPTSPGDEVESEVDMGTGQDDEDDEEESEESEMDSASSNASPSPLQTSMDINNFDPNHMSIVDLISQFSQPDDARMVPSPSSPITPSERVSQSCQTGPSEYPASFEGQTFQTMNSYIYASNNDRMVPEQLVDIPISLAPASMSPPSGSSDALSQHHQLQQEQERQQHQLQQQQLQQQHLQFQQLQQQALFPDAFSQANSAVTPSPLARRTSTSGGVGPVRRRRPPTAANPLAAPVTQAPLTTSTHANAMSSSPTMLPPTSMPAILGMSSGLSLIPPGFIVPKMTRLIPNTGPCFGGIEITVLGANFYAGLTAMFDSTPALPTQFWSPNTLICILPPRIQPGTTVVTFKEHPSITLPQSVDMAEMMLFTYVDESDKALMELALQVVGLKMTGRLEDARNIALRIVGSQVANGQQGQQQQQQQQQQHHGQQQQQGQQHQSMPDFSVLVRDLILSFGDQETDSEFQAGLEDRILTLLTVLSELPAPGQGVVNLARRDTGHRLLHFGAMKGLDRLVEALVAYPDIEIDAMDMNGYSALHYACWRGQVRSTQLLVEKGADVMLRSVHGVGCVDLATFHEPSTTAELIEALRTSNTWVDAGAQEVDGYESALEADEGSVVEEELEALSAIDDYGEDDNVWLEHYSTQSDLIEEEEEQENDEDDEETRFIGSEIEDLPWLDHGEWIGEEVSDESSMWSGSESGKGEDEKSSNQEVPNLSKNEDGDIIQAPSSPSLIPMATPLSMDAKDAAATDMASNWLQKTLSQLQSSSPAFDFEFFKALNQILPEKGAFLMNIPSMPTSIQAFNANIGTYMPYNFTGKPGVTNENSAPQVSEKQVYDQEAEPMLDEQAITNELWNLHNGPDSLTVNNNLTAPIPAPVVEEAPSRYLSVYHEPFSATSVLQQPVNSYAMPAQAQDPAYSPLTLTTAPGGAVSGATVTSPLSKVRRFYPPMGSDEPQQPGPAVDVGESSVVRGGRRIITEIVNNGAVVGGAAVAERAVGAVGENRHIQELRARYHQKMKRLKKDKMLFLFWVPVLLVMLALTIIRIASTFDVARQWTGGLMNLAGIQV